MLDRGGGFPHYPYNRELTMADRPHKLLSVPLEIIVGLYLIVRILEIFTKPV